MILQKVSIVGETRGYTIKIINDKITHVLAQGESRNPDPDELLICFDDALAFPGLINSHDHLEFNLFPQLGNRVYKSYLEWGPDIHEKNRDIISEIKKIPRQIGAEWGVHKNMLNDLDANSAGKKTCLTF